MGKTSPQKPVIRSLERNEMTNQLEVREVELAVPKWGWEYLQERAAALHDGDLNSAINEVFSAGLQAYVDLSTINMEPANKLPC